MRIKGIDVSKYQKRIDWQTVQRQGIDFAFIRVSDGFTVKDEFFEANWNGAQSVGIVRGAYQFFRASQSGKEQARMMVDAIEQAGGLDADDLPPVVDVESIGCEGVAPAIVIERLLEWLAEVERLTGRIPIIYTGVGYWNALGKLGNNKEFLRFPLWVYHTQTQSPSIPKPWIEWHFWQYTHTGGIRGIQGAVDENFFAGSREDLDLFNRATISKRKPQPDPETNTIDKPEADCETSSIDKLEVDCETSSLIREVSFFDRVVTWVLILIWQFRKWICWLRKGKGKQ